MGIFSLRKPNVEKLKAKRDIKGLIKALRHRKDCDIREQAAAALGELGDKRAVKPLIQAFDDYERVAEQAAEALGRIGEKRAVHPLIEALKQHDMDFQIDFRRKAAEAVEKLTGDKTAVEPLVYIPALGESFQVRTEAKKALIKLGDAAVDPLIQALKNARFSVKAGAAEVLRVLGDKRAVDPLIQALKENDPSVTREASRALEKLADETMVDPLIQALKDSHLSARAAAARILGDIGDKRAVEPLIQALSDQVIQHVVLNAVEALGKIGDKRAVKPLIQRIEPGIQALKEGKPFGHWGEDELVMTQAARALGKLGDKRAVGPLRQILEESKSQSDYARWKIVAEALEKIEGNAE